MTTNAEVLLDTSVAVPFLLRNHPAHDSAIAVLDGGDPLGLSGHAVFETISVLTRLPGNSRVSASTAVMLIEHNFPASRHLSARAAARAPRRIAELGITGGALYDALVALAALEHGRTLVTRDSRALPVYAALGVDVLRLD